MGKDIFDTLNELITVCSEECECCAQEGDVADDTGFAALLQTVSRRHGRLAAQLRAVVWQLGGMPVSTVALSERWEALHEALERHDAHEAVAELERAERQTMAYYAEALTDESITPPLREVLGRHQERLQDVLELVHAFDN